MAASMLILWNLEKAWSVQSLNTITEPKKKYGEVYKVGEEVVARFNGNPYPGIIIQIADNRVTLKEAGKKLEQLLSLEDSLLTSEIINKMQAVDDKELDGQPQTVSTVNVELGGKKISQKKDGEKKRSTLTGRKKKASPTEEEARVVRCEAQKEKESKIAARKEMCHEILTKVTSISEPQVCYEERSGENRIQEKDTVPGDNITQITNPTEVPFIQPEISAFTAYPFADQTPVWVDQNVSLHNQCFPSVSWLEPPHTLETRHSAQTTSQLEPLRSHQELQDMVSWYGQENSRLQEEVKSLTDEVKRLKEERISISDITPDKILFLKRLALHLENTSSNKGTDGAEQSYPESALSHSEAWKSVDSTLPVSGGIGCRQEAEAATEQGVSEWQKANTNVSTLPVSEGIGCRQEAGAATEEGVTEWQKANTASGMSKIELVEGSGVFLTKGQLSSIKNTPKAELKVRRLLDVFFPLEILARSCAYGKKTAPNKGQDGIAQSMPLDRSVVTAIQDYMKMVKDAHGYPELTETSIASIMNSRCSTARRTLRR